MLRPEPAPVHRLRLPHGERVTIRPVGPSDAGLLQSYVRGLSFLSRYNRFFAPLRELSPAELERVVHLDGRTQSALIAETCTDAGAAMVVGEARYALTASERECEFALSVADHWRGRGLGLLLLADVECRVRSLGAWSLMGDVLHSNQPMKALARKAGFEMMGVPMDPKLVRIEKHLTPARPAVPCEAPATSGFSIAA